MADNNLADEGRRISTSTFHRGIHRHITGVSNGGFNVMYYINSIESRIDRWHSEGLSPEQIDELSNAFNLGIACLYQQSAELIMLATAVGERLTALGGTPVFPMPAAEDEPPAEPPSDAPEPPSEPPAEDPPTDPPPQDPPPENPPPPPPSE